MTDKKKIDLTAARKASEAIAEFKRDPENARLLLESEIRFELSDFLKEARDAQGVTQIELARRVGCSQPMIAKLEAGGYDRMGFSGVRTYARAIGLDFVSIKNLFREIAEPSYTGHSTDFNTNESQTVTIVKENQRPVSFDRFEEAANRAWNKSTQPIELSDLTAIGGEIAEPDVAA